jgi:hypothetical protein
MPSYFAMPGFVVVDLHQRFALALRAALANGLPCSHASIHSSTVGLAFFFGRKDDETRRAHSSINGYEAFQEAPDQTPTTHHDRYHASE